MIAELGHLCLALAFVLSIVQAIVPLWGAAQGDARRMSAAASIAQGQAVFVILAYASLTWMFVQNDFSVRVVASHSNSALPLAYRIAAVWGGHEGSMLLWVLMLVGWTLAVTLFSRRLPLEVVARVIGVMGCISVGLHAFLLFTSNPFERLLPAVAEGRDLNPLLQDPGMVIHPPLLYMGYVGFSVAFAFAIAALLGGRLDAGWARWSRPWTTVAWSFLTMGIAIGSWWAYYELGWGGWWFWDPVENASFMPWLVGTALIHSLAVTEKRGSFRSWTVLLAIFAFSFSLMGTFLVRSGVLTSVHAFATDPKRGVFILAFLVVVIGSSLALFAWRAPRIGLGGSFDTSSRESLLLANNVVFSVATAAVMLGTLYPLALDALGLGKISVGPPYFERVFAPLMAPAVFLMGVGPLARWKSAPVPDLVRRLRWAAIVTVVAAVGAWMLAPQHSPWVAMGLALATWVMATSVAAVMDPLRHAAGRRLQALAAQPLGWWGMVLAHFGIGVFIVGVTMVKGFEEEKQLRMGPGDTAQLGGYTFRFERSAEFKGPNYRGLRADIRVERDGREVALMQPEKRLYFSSGMPMTEAAIEAGITGDVYVSLGDAVSDSDWGIRLQIKPFVNWIWGGCMLMALGGFLSASDRRYRLRSREKAAALSSAMVTP
ncbi:heme lyase CcmF/NrfE family subunit [Ideonella sp. A 288]|uniref:heme lyase CcmF/NrfE family subunit n=1 Tax=Ideonella sp. A 288 TaxID=1962181 RepID=UPI000B4B97E7|nr:heme lyase CcmF/NrfE family subunit [Ideonella sp. A 288]